MLFQLNLEPKGKKHFWRGAPEDAVAETITVDINNPNKQDQATNRLAAEDYKTSTRLYPMQFEEPLFHIH
jgi:molecular chaperone HtpG